jgi:hypothetical protein
MVASQFRPRTGARWLCEIETNGASAKCCAYGQIRQVETTVQGGEKRRPQPAQERQVHPVKMGMDHVEIASPFSKGL